MIKSTILEFAKENNGIITAKDLKKSSIPTVYLTRLSKDGTLFKVDKGIYITEDGTYDDYFFFQYRYSKAIYSYVSALYLLGLTDKIPQDFEVSVPSSYKFNNKKENVTTHYVSPSVYSMGIINVKTMFGNTVQVYNAERTICDLIADKDKIESEIYIKAIKSYMKSNDKDIKKLLLYASKMGIVNKVREMMEVYFE